MTFRAERLIAASSGGLAIAIVATAMAAQRPPASAREAESRAVAYLEREVPRWTQEHPCLSCHNNGDAGRALIAAGRRGHLITLTLNDTLNWLRFPERWDENKTEGGFDDKSLAHIQFAGALTSAREAGLRPITAEAAMTAATLVAADQHADGSWRLKTSQNVGSPVTYGTALSTWSALRTLRAVGDRRFAAAIARADTWVREVTVRTVLDASAITLALDRADDERASAQRRRCLEIVQRGQAPDGGWGPYVTSAAEPFDTAVALLALGSVQRSAALASPVYSPRELQNAIDRGTRFLIDRQLDAGSWPETTRPPNQESYAQRISTTAWALLALIEAR